MNFPVRLVVLAAAALSIGAVFAAPALANPCPTDATDPYIIVGEPPESALKPDPTNPSTLTKTQSIDGINVTITLTPESSTGVNLYRTGFTVTDNSGVYDYLATRAFVNPETDPFTEKQYNYTPAVDSASGLTANPATARIEGVKVCLTRSDVSTTAVSLRSFTATRSAKGAMLRWRTASEADVLGYNVYGLVKGNRVKLNARLIACKNPGANAYSFHYRAPKGKKAPARFWLQTIHLDGSRLWTTAAAS